VGSYWIPFLGSREEMTHLLTLDYFIIIIIYFILFFVVNNEMWQVCMMKFQASSAYWRGSKDRESLQRVYGISYPDQKRLKVFFINSL